MSARRGWGVPLVPVYTGVLALQRWMRARGWLKTRALRWPVVSVGSLSAGGAGKTPAVMALARVLAGNGWSPDVLSRGYGRAGEGVARVEADATDAAGRFGDEPVLIARAAGVPVWVGAGRFAAGAAAEAASVDDVRPVHLLDDGFQHRQLARAVDVVLITFEDLDDRLLPAGNLREPLERLAAADVVVIRADQFFEIHSAVRKLIAAETPVWQLERKLRFPSPLGVLSAGLKPVAFCALARPQGFWDELQAAGCGVVETIAFPDHHAYEERDIEHILTVAAGLKATGLVTSEKDAVKLSAAMRARLESLGPLVVVALDAEFLNPAEVIADLEARL